MAAGVLDYSEEARCTASTPDARQWAAAAQLPASFHFITQAFFLTAQCVHQGACKLLEELQGQARLQQELRAAGPARAREARPSSACSGGCCACVTSALLLC